MDWLAVIVLPAVGMVIGLAVLRDIFASISVWLLLLLPWLWLRAGSSWYLAYGAIVVLSFFSASIPTLRQYVRLRREDPAAYEAIVESSHMGRGLLRIGRLFGTGRKPRRG